MTSYITRPLLIARLAAIILLTCAIHYGVQAQDDLDSFSLFMRSLPSGLTRGETLRVTWANLNDEDPDKRVLEPLSLTVRLFDANGRIIAQKAAQAVGAGKFQSFDFNRDQINLPGEATGRLQFRCEVEVIGRVKYPNLDLKQGVAPLIQTSLEIIGNTGTTQSTSGTTSTFSHCVPGKGCVIIIVIYPF